MIEDAFLADIIAAPDDDAPRLIYADWLEDHGQQERAEFIRVQIQRERLDRWDVRQVALAQREADLLAEHRQHWEAPATHLCNTCQFRRGFLAGIWVPTSLSRADAQAIFRRHPLCELTYNWSAPGSLDILDLPALARIETLEVRGDLDDLLPLLFSPHWSRLTSLTIGSRTDADEIIDAFRRVPWTQRLRKLHLISAGLSSLGVDELHHGSFPDLESININYNTIRGPSLYRLLRSSALPQLRDLDIREIGLTRRDAIRLSTLAELLRLRRLDVGLNSLGTGAVDLLSSPHLAALETLAISGIETPPALLATTLAQSSHFSHLTDLTATNNRLAPQHLRELLHSHNLRRLKRLNLAHNPLGPEATALLASDLNPWQLTTLDLSFTSLGDDGLIALLGPHLSSLHSLSLHNNELGPRSARALAESPYLTNLRHLGLRNHRIGDEGADALARSTTLQLLTLTLDHNYLSDAGYSALLARFGRAVTFSG